MSALLSADSARFAAEHGLTEARVHVLWELHAAGPVPQHVLAARLGVAPRTVTGLVDGLVGSGHVERTADPADRRVVVVTPTAVGRRLGRSLVRMHGELAEQLFGGADPDDVAGFSRTAAHVLTTLRRLLADETGGAP